MGNSNPELSNDVWIININNTQCQWEKIIFENNSKMPCERLYHTCGICPKGNCGGMIIIFGGRDSEEKPLNDIWGLIKHRDGTWSWSNAEVKNGYQMKPRYNHSMVFYNELMIIIGGRGYSNGNNNQIPIEVFNTLNNEEYSFGGINMNRQTSFIYEKNIYLFGGFGVKNQKRPLGDLYQISLENLFGKRSLNKYLTLNSGISPEEVYQNFKNMEYDGKSSQLILNKNKNKIKSKNNAIEKKSNFDYEKNNIDEKESNDNLNIFSRMIDKIFSGLNIK